MREPAPMDVLVYGPLRSGTTLLADLLTVKGRSLVVSEPDLHVDWHPRTVARLHRLFRDTGLVVGEAPPERDGKRLYVDWFGDEIVPQLEALDLWGMKMVDFHEWTKLVERFPPRRLVLMTRDLRDTAASALDLLGRSLVAFPGGRHLRDEAWVMARIAHDAHEIGRMAALPHLHLRYEDFAEEASVRERLRSYVGIPKFGDDRFNLEGESENRVAWEKSKHKGRISAASVGRFAREPEGPGRALAERVWRLLPGFSARFGHEVPETPLAGHPWGRAADEGANPVRRVEDVDVWNGKGPDRLEPAFARRAGRLRVAQALAQPCRVLDLFCGAPALRFMLKQGGDYRGADLASRFEGCETIDLGAMVLPPRLDSELVTVIGALEYIEDLHGFLSALSRLGLPVLATYHATDDTRGTDRTELGWKNHLSRHDLGQAFASAGFSTEVNWVFDGRQSLLKAMPEA